MLKVHRANGETGPDQTRMLLSRTLGGQGGVYTGLPTGGPSPPPLLRYHNAAAAAQSLQSCPTLCDPIDGSPLGSTVPGILQARTLERVAISFSNTQKNYTKKIFMTLINMMV